MTTLMLCLVGVLIMCLLFVFLAIVKVGSREDRYREKLSEQDIELINKENELMRRHMKRVNKCNL
jgi:5-bromo-4-chloroindolyl phosphate hydrolysis protein